MADQHGDVAVVPRQSKYPMVPMEDAIELVLSHAAPLPTERVKLTEAGGRVLSEDVVATQPQPPFPASVKDGYAVVAADGPGTYDVVGEVTAGDGPTFTVTPGTVAYITTGAPVPPGADAVVQVEWTKAGSSAGQVVIERGVAPGNDIRPVGCDVAVGQTVLQSGDVVGEAEVGILAACGLVEVPVHRVPTVSLISTGDELVDLLANPSAELKYGQIYDSNRPMLSRALSSAGAVVRDMGIAPDDQPGVASLFADALQNSDIVVTSGGISMGNKDLVKAEIAARGSVHFGRVLMKPGKPLTFATAPGSSNGREKMMIALPGNPVSSYVCFHLVVEPAIRALAGHRRPRPPVVDAQLEAPIKLDPERPEFHRATLSWSPEAKCFIATSTGKQASSRLLSTRSANALLSLPNRNETLPAGAVVPALIIGSL